MEKNSTLSKIYDQWISNHTRHLSELACDAFLLPVFSLLGMVSNIVNLYVFVKHGLKNNMNLKFASLSCVDFFASVFSFLFSVCRIVVASGHGSEMRISQLVIYYMIGWLRIPLSRASACITMLITVERCLCVIIPLKVKFVCTRKLVLAVLCLIFTLFVLILIPVYFPIKVVLRRLHNEGLSRVDVDIGDDAQGYNHISHNSSSALMFLSYAIMFLSTLFLIRGLLKQGSQRKSMVAAVETSSEKVPSSSSQTSQSARDVKAMKVVVLVALMFVFCSLPEVAMSILTLSYPGVSITGGQTNIFFTGWAVVGLAVALNSSLNILIYAKMNSAYRKTLNELFHKGSLSK